MYSLQLNYIDVEPFPLLPGLHFCPDTKFSMLSRANNSLPRIRSSLTRKRIPVPPVLLSLPIVIYYSGILHVSLVLKWGILEQECWMKKPKITLQVMDIMGRQSVSVISQVLTIAKLLHFNIDRTSHVSSQLHWRNFDLHQHWPLERYRKVQT